jgi:hypothetical protein
MTKYTKQRTCLHCGKPISDEMRHGTKFCKPSCRVNYHFKTRQPEFSFDVALSAAEAGLLLDAKEPWVMPGSVPKAGCDWAKVLGMTMNKRRDPTPEEIAEWRELRSEAAKHKRFQRARRRLVALGLLEQNKGWASAVVVRRTALGTKLVKRRHIELAAKAEHAGEVMDPDGRHRIWVREGMWGYTFRRGGGWND